MPPKAQKRVVIESRETRLAKMKQKDEAPAPAHGVPGPNSKLASPRPLSATGSQKKRMPGMSQKGNARRKAAAVATATEATSTPAVRLDAALAQLSDPPSALDGPAAAGGVVNNEGAVLSRSAGIYLERAAETARAMELLKSSAANGAPAVVVAASGAGKSTFLAHLVSRIQAEKNSAFDTVLAVFVGATDGSTSIHRICTDVLAALRGVGEQDENCDDIDGEATDFQGLVAQIGSMLKTLSAAGHRTCLLFDAVNELDGAHAARSLRWLPAQLPDGCSVLLSTIGDKAADPTMISKGAGDESVQEIATSLSARWGLRATSAPAGQPGCGVMFLPTLSEADRMDLLGQLVVASGGRPLGAAESQAALAHEDSVSPLYLKLLAQRVAVRAAEGKAASASQRLKEIEKFPPTIAAVFDTMLVELDSSCSSKNEDSGDGWAAGVVLSAVHCSQGGLYEQQLHQLLLTDARAGAKAAAEVELLWKQLVEAGLPSIVRVRENTEATQPSTIDGAEVVGLKPVGFVHMQARDAVKRRYLKQQEIVQREHRRLGEYFSALLKLAEADDRRQGDRGMLLGPSALGTVVWRQCLRRVPLHHSLGCDWEKAAAFLCSIEFIEAKAAAGLSHELLEDYDRAISLIRINDDGPMEATAQSLEDFRDCVRRSQHILSVYPALAQQLALNERDDSAAAKVASISSSTHSRMTRLKGETDSTGRCNPSAVTLRWLNKPQVRPACVRTFTGFGSLIWALDTSRDGRLAAVGGSDKCIHVIELATGLEIATLIGHTDDITFCCFSPVDDSVIISAADKDPLFCWSVSSCSITSKIALGGDCNGLTWSLDGQFVCSMSSATTARQKILRVFEIAQSVLTWEAVLANDSYSCAFGPDGQVACGDSHVVRVWNATAQRKLAAESDDAPVRDLDTSVKLVGHRAAVRAVAWAGDTSAAPAAITVRRLLASSSADETVRIWDVDTGTCISVLAPGGVGTAEEVVSLCFDLSGRLLTASSDKTLRLWSFDEVACAAHKQAHKQAQAQAPAAAPEPEPEPAGSDGDDEDSDGNEDVAHLQSFDAGGWVERAVMRGHSNGLRAVCALAPPNTAAPSNSTSLGRALSAADDGSVRLWSLDEALTAGMPWGHSESITACAWSMRQGRRVVVSADGKGNVQCQPPAAATTSTNAESFARQRVEPYWQVKVAPVSSSCEAIAAMVACDGPRQPMSASSPSSSSSVPMVACAMYQQCVVLSVEDGSVLSRLTFGAWANTCCSLTTTNSLGLRLLAAGGDSGTLAVWRGQSTAASAVAGAVQAQQWQQCWQDGDIEEIKGVSGDIMCCALSPGGAEESPKDGAPQQQQHCCWLYAGTNEGTVIIWKVEVAGPPMQLYKLRLDGEQYGSSWVLSVFSGPVLQLNGRQQRLLGAAVGGQLGATVIWAVPMDGSSDKEGVDDDQHVLNLEPYAQRIGNAGGSTKGVKGGIVWGAFLQLSRTFSPTPPQECQQQVKKDVDDRGDDERLPAVVTASTAKALTVWRIQPAAKASAGNSGNGPGGLEMVGLFPASGSFGSPDGIGGQAAVIEVSSESQRGQEAKNDTATGANAEAATATTGLRPVTTLAKLAIGDQGGLLYTLALEIETETG